MEIIRKLLETKKLLSKSPKTYSVVSGADVYPVSFISTTHADILPAKLSKKLWMFQTTNAHVLEEHTFRGTAILDGEPAAFIKFPEAIQDNGVKVDGFLCRMGHIRDASAAFLTGKKQPIPPSTTTVNKPIFEDVFIKSSSNPKRKWKVTVYEDGSVSCNCPAWTRNPDKKTGARNCKHLTHPSVLEVVAEI